jgi:phosphatidylinositol alpha-mannosyltransferase
VLTSGEEGLAVTPRDADKLAQAIFKLAGDENLRREMGQRGTCRAGDYDWPVLARRVLDFYHETLARVRGTTPEVVGTKPATSPVNY